MADPASGVFIVGRLKRVEVHGSKGMLRAGNIEGVEVDVERAGLLHPDMTLIAVVVPHPGKRCAYVPSDVVSEPDVVADCGR